MNNRRSDIPVGIDNQMLSALLIDLNIARRNARSYPKGHPLILASLQKVRSSYDVLMQASAEIAIGVARDVLIVDGVSFDKANPVFRDFARVLFERGIAALVLRPGISIDELRNFILLLGLRQEDIQKHGGIENLWLKARISTLSVRPIRYDLFTTTDENIIVAEAKPTSGGTLWERFARHVQQGAGLEQSAENFDPELVAAILNGQHDHRLRADSSSDVDTLADLVRHLGSSYADGSAEEGSFNKLGTLVSKLNPELRRQFLSSSFADGGAGDSQAARELVHNLSFDAVLEILEDVNTRRAKMPPVIVGMLQRLAEQGGQQHPAENEGAGVEDPETDKIRSLFREHATEEFTPDEYQRKLNRIMAADALPQLQGETVDELLGTLEPHFVESRISEIILQIAMAEPDDAGSVEGLARYLRDMCAYFLETGEYEKLLNIMRQSSAPEMPQLFSRELRNLFSSPEFMEEILNGLKIWGKPRFEQIRGIIFQVGEPFIAVLLDQLEEESSMSLRRFIMDRLIEFGSMARKPVVLRLSDNRWYFLRNLLIILRSMNDPSILDHLRPLVGHDNPQVRQEVFKILLNFQDAGAEEQLLRDLDSSVPGVQLTTVPLAVVCASPVVLKKLVAILNRPGFSAADCELKSAVVKALGEVGKTEVLPELAKVLGATSLLHAKQLAKLKEELVHSLEHYPHQIVVPILQRLANGRDEVARQAAATLRKIEGRQP